MSSLLFDPVPFTRDVSSQLSRDEQDALFAYLWYVRVHAAVGLAAAFPTDDDAFNPEYFRTVELAAMAHGQGLTTPTQVKALLRAGFQYEPSKARIQSVIQTAKQELWLHL